jgi:16S rRNA G1207 methylase RsmC
VTFIDESHMAVASAQLNVRHNPAGCPAPRPLLVNNCLDGVAVGSVDGSSATAFHQLQAITDHIAWQMFSDAHRVLPQGRRTLDSRQPSPGLSQQLKRLFANAQVVASNSKFVILKAIKR